MGKTLEDIINRHGLNVATDVPYTFKRCDNWGKSKIDLTLTRGLKNLKVKTKEIETIKTESQAIEIEVKDETIISNPKFKRKNASWAEWKEFLKPRLEDYLEEFPTEISEKEINNQTKKLTDIIIYTATLFFGQTEATKKETKGWWSRDIKKTSSRQKEK